MNRTLPGLSSNQSSTILLSQITIIARHNDDTTPSLLLHALHDISTESQQPVVSFDKHETHQLGYEIQDKKQLFSLGPSTLGLGLRHHTRLEHGGLIIWGDIESPDDIEAISSILKTNDTSHPIRIVAEIIADCAQAAADIFYAITDEYTAKQQEKTDSADDYLDLFDRAPIITHQPRSALEHAGGVWMLTTAKCAGTRVIDIYPVD